ncbi:F0F1 ATP synthase subunit alpha [Candidatus Saccharibacteria bacterium]|nr:F0F1 ATP synthase subunit alpha [Candidatus Saccharibacteria bacterium]NCU40657.1 F0F1 ATP synthase subunit alpha [Candidatus Saccharibacteria bacterium]
MSSIGTVDIVKGEICVVKGLESVGLGSVVSFSSGSTGVVMGFFHDTAEVALLSSSESIKKGDLARVTSDMLTVPAGDQLLGRIINTLGLPIDGLGNIDITPQSARPLESPAKPVYQRAIIDKPFVTGFLTIDSQIPLSLGQRELLLGEKMSGQSELAIDAICNQARLNADIICIYVCIDAETARVKRRVERLQQRQALSRTIIIFAGTSDTAMMNYFAPMTGVAIAEWFASQGKNVLVVFDDLTRHAKVYRQISLLLERPAGRESYPGDIFYLHSRLLERCGAFSESCGGGTITALPVVETQSEDATDYIATNLMSITDGHILFRRSLQNEGKQPPIDSGFSVSRIGGRNQPPLLRDLSEKVKETMIRYDEAVRFTSLGNDIGSESLSVIELGKRAESVFQQHRDAFYSLSEQAILMHLIASHTLTKWSEVQIPDIVSQIIAYARDESKGFTMNETLLTMPIDEAKNVLDEYIKNFMNDSATLRPIQKRESLVAEIESVDSLLRSNEDILQ